MFNSYNPYSNPYNNPMDRIDNQIRELENLKKGYQNLPQQPTNIFNVGNNTPQINFEARILEENEKPEEILVQRKTMFFDDKKGRLYIKELNGDLKEYKVELPKTKMELENEELKKKIQEMEKIINENEKKQKKESTNNTSK